MHVVKVDVQFLIKHRQWRQTTLPVLHTLNVLYLILSSNKHLPPLLLFALLDTMSLS